MATSFDNATSVLGTNVTPANDSGLNAFVEDVEKLSQRDDLDEKWFPKRFAPRNELDEQRATDGFSQSNNVGDKWFPQKTTLDKDDAGGDVDSSSTNSVPDPQLHDDDKGADGDVNNGITYHYLTFATELPPPSQQSPDAPAIPDLAPFQNPFTWSSSRKNVFVVLSCLATASAAYAAGAYAYAVDDLIGLWHISETVCLFGGITLFTLGFGAAPLVLAPFSEINGRRPVFLVTGFLFLVFSIISAVTPTFAGMAIARFFSGGMSSTFSTMVGGVLADIYVNTERNTPMTAYTGAVFFATGLGPLLSGCIVQHISWRWIFGVHAILVGLLVIALTVFFRETRGNVLLSRKAKALNQWYEVREAAGFYGFDMPIESKATSLPEKRLSSRQSQRIRWKVKADEDRSSLQRMIATSCYRPFHLLCTEPVVFFFSIWVSFAWGILYMLFDIIPFTFRTVYGFSVEQTAAIFASITIASIIATVLNVYQEKIAIRSGRLSGSPESRLYFCCIESALLPAGLFLFGWTARPEVHWIFPTIGIVLVTLGIFSIYLAVFNYFADCYGQYASSAIAASSACRNFLCGAFPLFSQQMFVKMGYGFGGAGSMLGSIGVLLTFVPWVLAFYGKKIRARSKICSMEMQD